MALVAAIVLAAVVVPAPWGIPLVCGAIVLEVGEASFWWHLSHRRPASVGVEILVGDDATVVLPCRPRGQVRVGGELWQATCREGADPGETVEVTAVDGLRLLVARR